MQAPPPNADVSWYVRWGARGLGVVGGVLSLVLGLWAMITLSAKCLAAGVLQMVFGFIVLVFEAPFCCMWFDFAERLGSFSENRPVWQKAAIYCGMGIVPLFMCFEASTFLGSGLIFIAGCAYGYLTLGKKADRDSMIAAASSQQNITTAGATDNAWDTKVHEQKPYP